MLVLMVGLSSGLKSGLGSGLSSGRAKYEANKTKPLIVGKRLYIRYR